MSHAGTSLPPCCSALKVDAVDAWLVLGFERKSQFLLGCKPTNVAGVVIQHHLQQPGQGSSTNVAIQPVGLGAYDNLSTRQLWNAIIWCRCCIGVLASTPTAELLVLHAGDNQ